MSTPVTLIPGDGIGPSIASATVRILEAAGADIQFDSQCAGMAGVAKYGDPGDVYFYVDASSQKKVVTYFFWKGGIAITTAGGMKLSETVIPKLAK